jgi:predicted nucleic acid-binding protein
VAALIDSSVFIAAEHGALDLDAILASHAETGMALAVISASELLHGVHRLRASRRKTRAEAFVEGILSQVPVVPFDLLCARAHARIGADLARRGVTLGAHDLLIAATAMARGLSVVTRDRRGFGRVPDLAVEVW